MVPSIYSLLSESKLAEALELIGAKVASLRHPELSQQYYSTRENYIAYLHAQISHNAPVDQPTFIRLIQEAYEINDKANRIIRILKSPNDIYSKTISSSSETLFNKIWVSDIWTEEDVQYFHNIIDINAPQYPLIISAITLSLYEIFDVNKISFLFDAYLSSDVEVSMRALVGIILILYRYDNRIHQYPQILKRLELTSESTQFTRQFYNALIILQYSKMTDSVSDKMQHDILPAIINSTKFKHTESGFSDINDALTSNGENLDWIHNDENDKKAEKQMQKMAKMQMDGADIYMTTFRQLKSFPFFNTISNWFIPFSEDNPDLPDVINKPLVRKLLKFTPFCNSDKYSFLFIISQISENNLSIITNQMTEQLPDNISLDEAISDTEKDINAVINGEKEVEIARKYVQDLYRFFNIYQYRSQFFNPFDSKLSNFTPLNRKAFSFLLSDNEQLLSLADFFMRKGCYQDALDIFTFVHPHKIESDYQLWQKIGFCYQKQGNDIQAYQALFIAHQLDSQSHWTITHLIQTGFNCKKYHETIQYLDIMLKDDDENIKYLTKKAECHFALDEYKLALPLLYKVTYLDNALLGHQMLAWGLLMTNSLDKAEKEYYICKEMNDISACIYLGHICVAKNNLEQSLLHYKEALHQYKNNATNETEALQKFKTEYWRNADYLKKLNISTETLKTLYDGVILIIGVFY